MSLGFRWTSIKLGIFTIVTVLVTTWLAAIIGNFQLFASPYVVTAEFKDASGLLKGDVVKAAGVTIGRVESISVDGGMAIVEMSLDENTEVPSGVAAHIRFRNLVGQRMVTLVDEEGGSNDLLADGDHIPLDRTESAFDLTVLFNGLRPLIRSTNPEDINIVSREVVAALGSRKDDVASLFSNLADISDLLASKDEELDVLLEGVNLVTSDLAARDLQIQNSLGSMNSFLADLSAARGDLAGALENLDIAARKFGKIIRRNDDRIAGELADLEIVLDALDDRRGDLRKIVRGLPSFLTAVQRVTDYGEWGNQHLIHLCKDDLGTCGTRWKR